jgi:hypothetical protein
MSPRRKEILDQITEAIDETLADAPATINESRRNEIRDEVLADAVRVIEACSTEELQSEKALQRFLEGTLADFKRQMRLR